MESYQGESCGKSTQADSSRTPWPPVTMRAAEDTDVQLLLEWRNEIETRRASFSMEPVTLEQHMAWFARRKQFIQIAMIDKVRAGGQIRVELGEVSYSVDRRMRCYGIGTQMVRAVMGAEPLIARVKVENLASRRVFEKLDWKRFEAADHVIYNYT